MEVLWTASEFIAAELDIDKEVADNLTKLFDDGNEIAFIARYRRNLTKNASPDDLRHALDAYNTAKATKAKAEKLIKRAESEIEDARQKESVKNALSRTMDPLELDSLFEPFKKAKNGTLAHRALQLGMGTVCEKIRNGAFVDFNQYVNPSEKGLASTHDVEKEAMNLLADEVHRLEDTTSFLKKLCEPSGYPGVKMSVVSALTKKAQSLKPGDKDFSQIEQFKLYTAFDKDVRYVQPFQMLALERAASKGIITFKVRIAPQSTEKIVRSHPGLKLRVHSSHRPFLSEAVELSAKKFLIPSVERCIRRRLSEQAERSAIDCFAKNLRELLLTAPVKGNPVLAIDPGFSHGCKCALIDSSGEVIDTSVFYLKNRKGNGEDIWEFDKHAQMIVISLVDKAKSTRVYIAIGNGKGSRETQKAVAEIIKQNLFAPTNVQFCVISECGASIYSATDLAQEELPNLDINLRSAVSLARRVIDPISEYVKIPPRSLGVGLYQHSVNEKRLDEMLDIVVRECVSTVGVDVNVASLQLLQKVSGLNKKSAANIIEYRRTKGRILNRETITKIKGIGPKSFEQSAGFLFVYNDGNGESSNESEAPKKKKKKLDSTYNPLDSTRVHPESYHLARKLATVAGLNIDDISSETSKAKLISIEDSLRKGEQELIPVWELLCLPSFISNPPLLMTSMRTMASLKEDEILDGVIMNHAQFGVFIDVGVGFNALAHHSKLPPLVPSVNARVRVKVISLELDRHRIGVVIV